MSKLMKFVSKCKLLHILVFMVVVAAATITGSVTDISINDGDVTFGIKGVVYATTPDYTLDGTDDDVEVQAVLDGFPSGGGRIHLFAGDYQFHETVWRAIDNVTILGAGACTVITTEGASDAPFDSTGQTGWTFASFACDDAPDYDTTNGATSSTIVAGIWINGTYTIDYPSPESVSRTATLVIAASDAGDLEKAQADFICDGTNDDVELQAAIDLVGTANSGKYGGRVVMSSGTFYITATSNPTDNFGLDFKNYQRVTLEGQGSGAYRVHGMPTEWSGVTTLYRQHDADLDAIIGNTCNGTPYVGIELRNFCIEGYSAHKHALVQDGNAIRMRITQSTIQNVAIQNCWGDGIFLDSNSTLAFENIIQACRILDCDGNGLRFGAYTSDSHVSDTIVGACTTALLISSGQENVAAGSRFLYSNCHLYGGELAGYYAATNIIKFDGAGTGSQFANCYIEKAMQHNVLIELAEGYVKEVIFTGCSFLSPNHEATPTTPNQYDDILVTRNHGAYTLDGLVIDGCTFSKIGGVGNDARYGINIAGSYASNVKVSENYFNSSYFDTAVINDAGTGSMIIGNTPDTYDNQYFEIDGDTLNGQVVLSGSGLIYLRFRPVLDQDMIRKNAKPDVIYRGLVRGFSMPIYASDAEELFFTEPYCPARWDGASDIIVRVSGYLDTANDTKRFKLNLAWEHQTPGTDVITTSEHSDNVETLTGTWSQYQSFYKEFTIDYNVDGADVVTKGDVINMRLRRVAKAGAEAEITGEVVITGVTMKYRCDKFGSSA